MNVKSVNPLLLIGLIGFFTIGSSFFVDVYRVFFGPKDIFWTHQSMQLPLDRTNNDFELLVSGKLLQKHLSEQTLLAVDANGTSYIVVAKDISVRMNRWDRVKSGILARTVFTGFVSGIMLTLLLIGLFQTFIPKNRAEDS